jgi:hypothetical protein
VLIPNSVLSLAALCVEPIKEPLRPCGDRTYVAGTQSKSMTDTVIQVQLRTSPGAPQREIEFREALRNCRQIVGAAQ